MGSMRFAAGLTALAVLAALAACQTVQPVEAPPFAPAVKACPSLPDNAATRMPRNFAGYAVLECTDHGQVLFARAPDFWLYPGGGMTLAVVPAVDPDAPLGNAGKPIQGYFTTLDAREPEPDDMAWLDQRRRHFGIDAPDRVIALYAETNLGTPRTLMLGLKGAEGRPDFGFWCKGRCAATPEASRNAYPFVVLPMLPRNNGDGPPAKP